VETFSFHLSSSSFGWAWYDMCVLCERWVCFPLCEISKGCTIPLRGHLPGALGYDSPTGPKSNHTFLDISYSYAKMQLLQYHNPILIIVFVYVFSFYRNVGERGSCQNWNTSIPYTYKHRLIYVSLSIL
jgi:hypothetical protein